MFPPKGKRKVFYKFLIVLFLSNYTFGDPNEKRLLHHLLDKYNTLERPVRLESDPLLAHLDITINEILDVDITKGVLVTNLWLNLEWVDWNLNWDPMEFGGITELRIPLHRIWKPDILMSNPVDEGFDATYPTNVIVRNNGSCVYIPPGIFKSVCEIDLTWFPFDQQKCDLKFRSWAHNLTVLDINTLHNEGDISSFSPNGNWKLLGFTARRDEVNYDSTTVPDLYTEITFTVHIQRYPQRFIFSLLIPVIFISSLAVLSFLIPPDSSAKLIFGPVTLIMLSYYLKCFALPSTKYSAPIVTTYMTYLMCMVFSSVVASIGIVNLDKRGESNVNKMAKCSRKLVLKILPRYLLMTVPNDLLTTKGVVEGNGQDVTMASSEWKFAASVLDRICLVCITIFVILATLVFLFAGLMKSFILI